LCAIGRQFSTVGMSDSETKEAHMYSRLTIYLARARADELLRQTEAARLEGGQRARRRRRLLGREPRPVTDEKRWQAACPT